MMDLNFDNDDDNGIEYHTYDDKLDVVMIVGVIIGFIVSVILGAIIFFTIGYYLYNLIF